MLESQHIVEHTRRDGDNNTRQRWAQTAAYYRYTSLAYMTDTARPEVWEKACRQRCYLHSHARAYLPLYSQ